MRASWFARPRVVLVPTLTGWAALAAALAMACTLAARALPGFLAVDEPVGRGVLIVEGWLPRAALDHAAQLAREGRYDAVAVTGGPIRDPAWAGGFPTYAERAGAYLRTRDLGGRALLVVPAPGTARERTWESALALRRFLDASGRRVEAADVFTSGPHARRSRALFRRALGDGTAVGAVASPPEEYLLARWWRRSEGARDVLSETTGYGWMLCCFWPDDGG
jgi:hypothetical protein